MLCAFVLAIFVEAGQAKWSSFKKEIQIVISFYGKIACEWT